jgi:YVTN family beta-propeller protein
LVYDFVGKIGEKYNPENLTAIRHSLISSLKTGSNPRRMALSGDGKTLVVANYLGDSLTVIDTAKQKVTRNVSLNGPLPDAARRGEILFNSAKLTQFGQFTCASCHPNGGSDGLSWDLPRDGIGNPLKTRSLLGVKDTAPYGWHGTSATLTDRVYGTLTTLHGYEPTKDQVADLVAYLQTLEPRRPLPKKLLNQEKVARGKTLFHGKAGCVKCHAGPTYQDGKTHNIGTARPWDVSPAFDTPSLRGVVYTAPYLHDGRAETLAEIFTKHNGQHKHGNAHELKAAELVDLVEFMKSL